MITPKFEVGDHVFVVQTDSQEKQKVCPDCLGTTWWNVTTPGGDEFEVRCNACHYGWEHRGVLTYHETVARSVAMVVGSVRVDTNDENPVSYMMVETGVGPGRIWYEDLVFKTRDEANQKAIVEKRRWQDEQDARDAARDARARDEAVLKPSYEQRRIRELEKQLAAD